NLFLIVVKRIRFEGFMVLDYGHYQEEFIKDVSQWILNGDIIYLEDVAQGLDNAPEALTGIFHGKNFGKGVIKIADL
ncbi:hypothetical protein BGZ83_011249, partial [Gryganskiella cystojenkinii]